MKNNNTIPAVDKALSAIEYMCSEGRSVTQAEICRAAGVTATTGYRIVQTLIRHNWIRRTRGNSYSLSLGMLDVWMKSRSHGVFFENIQPILDALASTTRLACKLSIRQGDEQVSVLRAESPEPFSVSGKNGARFPVIEGSVGTVLLCGESEGKSADSAKHARPIFPKKTIRSFCSPGSARPGSWDTCSTREPTAGASTPCPCPSPTAKTGSSPSSPCSEFRMISPEKICTNAPRNWRKPSDRSKRNFNLTSHKT